MTAAELPGVILARSPAVWTRKHLIFIASSHLPANADRTWSLVNRLGHGRPHFR
jgi:hypothetical protein